MCNPMYFSVVALGIPLPPTTIWRKLPQHIPQLRNKITLILEVIGYSKVCKVNYVLTSSTISTIPTIMAIILCIIMLNSIII